MLFLFPLSVVTIYRPCNHHIWLLKKRNCKFLKEFLHARFGMTEFYVQGKEESRLPFLLSSTD